LQPLLGDIAKIIGRQNQHVGQAERHRLARQFDGVGDRRGAGAEADIGGGDARLQQRLGGAKTFGGGE